VLKLRRSDAPQIKREIESYRKLSTVKAKHAGSSLVRTMLDSFDLHANWQIYPCIVHNPLGMSMAKLRAKMPNKRLPENILKLTLIHILLALDFLHPKANIIHAGKVLSHRIRTILLLKC
jgi:serine/threonine-protein kinase SRPK3